MVPATNSITLLDIAQLQRDAPKTLAGYRRFRSVIEEDGALPARIKRLFTTCAATIKGYEDMALRELNAASEAGLGAQEAGAALAILSSVRGEGAALRYRRLFLAVYPEAAEPAARFEDFAVAPDEAEANFLAYFGEIPPSLGKLIELVPQGADAYYLMREGTLSGTTLGTAYAELLLVCVLCADYSPWASVHINGARKASVSEAAIAEAIICAVPTSGLSAWVVGATAMDA